MPAGPGEQLLTTLFADVHYYFSDPAARPSHHRFDKGSYVYLFYNANSYQSKLEVANYAGTPHQDAFHGYMQLVHVRFNHLQPNLVSLTVDTNALSDQSTWHLPAYDARNEQKYMYMIHAVDIYFWTEKDASTFLRHLKSALPVDRLDIKGAPGVCTPHSEHRDSMSPVVQQLEKTAIGTNFPPRTMSAVSAQSFPGPPTPQSDAASPKPIPAAYNPAAPAAPEPVQYREKTPPPPDDGTGTGLKQAPSYSNVPQQPQYASVPGVLQTSAQTTPQNAYFNGHRQQAVPGPPQSAHSFMPRSHSGSIPPPPAQSPPTGTSTPSFGPMAISTIGPSSPPVTQTSFNRQSSYGPGPTQFANYNPQLQYSNFQTQQGQLPPTPSAPPAYAGHTPLASPTMPLPPPGQPYQPQQQAPLGGYSNYSYATAGAANSSDINQHGAYTGDVHSQVYRPTEFEHQSHGKLRRAQTSQDGTQAQKASPLQNSVGKAEKKVGKFLSKLDKLY